MGVSLQDRSFSTFVFHETFFDPRFRALSLYWIPVEVPRGCIAEAPWVFFHFSMELLDERSVYWRFAYTLFEAYAVLFTLFEVYNFYRLWAFSVDMIRDIRRLDFPKVVGSEHKVA